MNLSASSSSSLLSSSPSSSSSSTTSWFSGIVRGRSDKSGSIKMANNSVASDPSGSGGPVNRKNPVPWRSLQVRSQASSGSGLCSERA
ncbi:hypothetical protein CK203_075253 [Vitis vinifera]|uniref:Uncharacterized protein n=1 Tax=Vitis vinifera TaxID=29760 RepID=A0A438F656_VITVI|nr:hypothetical protein CK203_075253 [Vitis vinifera]